ncbi:copper homeostasis protein CutC [Parasphaerochaeta coccoides]|uniref:PF03932 family protein CutC n=1 Tax=Parasphaerochaeta coccoides (strain ATCC BAA-1237 / DSM 17374 / SPN1) TaxID=760011 RepID=F4GLW5_PARC1|nr:copper homeostasis protein CutC [Parasphaerochaeta coccoides]AEC03006.1 CutC family protein [Parasphaerochaeta coccoides DSM 17374]
MDKNTKPLIEVCLESAESVVIAEQAGAHRVELCSDLFEGGLTPTPGAFRIARRSTERIVINVMIRPRGGDFCYSQAEFDIMKEDIHVFREEGADAVVFGILTPDAVIDYDRTAQLIAMARPMGVTFHRAFDMSRDIHASLQTLITLGVDRVLTSGGEATVPEGKEVLADLVREAGEKIIVMPGCGLTERNFARMHKAINACEYHVFLPQETESRMTWRPGHIYMGGTLRQPEFSLSRTDSHQLKSVLGA